MTDVPPFMRQPTDIAIFALNEDTIPQLINETGLTEAQWRNVLSTDRQYGLQSKVYIVPSEVRWRALLEKVVDYYFDDDDDLYKVGFTAEDVRVLKALKKEE